MSTPTTNYGLIKAAEGEQYDVDITNGNLDAIDLELKKINNAKHFEAVRVGQTDNPAGTLHSPGALLTYIDAANSVNHTEFLSTGAGDSLKFTKEGVYTVNWKIVPATQVNIWHIISTDVQTAGNANSFALGRTVSVVVPAQDPYFMVSTFYVPPAGLDVYFRFSCGTAGTTLSHRVKISKVG